MAANRPLEEGSEIRLDFEKLRTVARADHPVIPVAVQDVESKAVLMIGYANRRALDYALEHRVAAFWSTSRNELWIKGNTSGNRLELIDVRINCEQNSLLYLVRLKGDGACHTRENGRARHGCYYRSIRRGELAFVDPKTLPEQPANVAIARIRADQWQILKTTRLRALEDAPDAFCTTLAEARKRTDGDWRDMARDHATWADRAYFMAYVDGAPRGMAGCYRTGPHAAVLTAMWVAPEVRGQKLGERIVRAVVQWAKAGGATTLEARVIEDNSARVFYRKIGFRERESPCSNADGPIISIALDLADPNPI